jgi:Transposase DDE domain
MFARGVLTAPKCGPSRHRYWTNACRTCAIKSRCTKGAQRRIARWEHKHVLEEVQKRLDENPKAMRQRRETVEHTFGTIKMRMGATHLLMKGLPRVATEMALHVLAYNLTPILLTIVIPRLYPWGATTTSVSSYGGG